MDTPPAQEPATAQPRRPLCYRHHPSYFRSSYASDHAGLLERLAALPEDERSAVRAAWAAYESARPLARTLIADGILHASCLQQLSHISVRISTLARVDFIAALPTEIAFNILRYLDGKSLCYCAQVSRRWRAIADDDAIWHRMCTQHIDRKCEKCGWGLPLMQRQPPKRLLQQAAQSAPPASAPVPPPELELSPSYVSEPESKRLRTDDSNHDRAASAAEDASVANAADSNASQKPQTALASSSAAPVPSSTTVESSARRKYRRPWKDVYAERLIVERNWRSANFTSRDLIGHSDGIMALDYDDHRGILITGSYDHTLRAWNVNSGECLGIMRGHTLCVRGVQFDDTKIISCSMDHTLRIWSMADYACLRVIEGHNEGVVCLHFTDLLLASGSTDGVIRVRDLVTGISATLNGHTDWINKLRIMPCKNRLLSCSDDTTTRLWDIHTRQVLRIFSGHVAPIQSLEIVFSRHQAPPAQTSVSSSSLPTSNSASASGNSLVAPLDTNTTIHYDNSEDASIRLVTCSLDHTIKIWNFHTGRTIHTLFGHVEGVWCVDADSLRVVSGSQDHTLKIWDLNSGKFLYTIEDHKDAINCCRITDTKMISADQHGVIKVRDFLHRLNHRRYPEKNGVDTSTSVVSNTVPV